MKSRLALVLVAIAVCAAIPAAAITVTGTGGCTTAVANITSTINYDGPSTFDPAGYTTYTTPFFDQGTDPGCGGDFLSQNTGQSTTVTFSTPVDYVGFVWGTPDGYNTVEFFNGNTSLGSYNGGIVSDNYMNFFADPGEQFTSVVFSSNGCCYETDNFSYRVINAGVPEPATLALLGSGFVGLVGVARRKLMK